MKRPNIVFLLSDDQSWWSLGCAGNAVQASRMERLMKALMEQSDCPPEVFLRYFGAGVCGKGV